MKKTFILLLAIFMLIIAGCSQQQEQNNDEIKKLEVDLQVPQSADIGEKLEFIAVVTYGDEMVDDAYEVLFEIWEKGKKDESIKINYEHHENGTYKLAYQFDEKGVYDVQVHVTAKSSHVMPVSTIFIGGATMDDYNEHDEENEEDEDHHH